MTTPFRSQVVLAGEAEVLDQQQRLGFHFGLDLGGVVKQARVPFSRRPGV